MSRSFGSRWLTTRPPIVISPPRSPRGRRPSAGRSSCRSRRADEDHELPVGDLEVELLDRARSVGVGLLEAESPISATGHLQHHLPARAARLGELGERAVQVGERESVGDQPPGPEATGVQQPDDLRPGRGRVAEARDQRQVVVDERDRPASSASCRPAAARAASRAATAQRGIAVSVASVTPAASIARSNPEGGGSVVKESAPSASASSACSGRRPARRSRAGHESRASSTASSAIVPSPTMSTRMPGADPGLLEPGEDDRGGLGRVRRRGAAPRRRSHARRAPERRPDRWHRPPA